MSKPVRDSLRKILADGALLQVDPEGQVQLTEKNYSVTLVNIPGGSLVIKPDALKPEGFINGDPYGRRADYVLIDFASSRLTFIELKSRNPNYARVKDQLRGAQATLAYVAALMVVFEGIDPEWEKYERRFVLFQSSGGKDSRKHNTTPDQFLSLRRGGDKPVPYVTLRA
mgnify:CR=1 FL=1